MVLGIIGVGNIASALISGIIKSKSLKKSDIIISNYNKEKSAKLVKKYGIISDNNENVIIKSDIVLLSVKPYQICNMFTEYYSLFQNKLIISVAAGISLEDMVLCCNNHNYAVIRAMVNTPAAICEGVTAYTKNPFVSDIQEEMFKKVFSSLGSLISIEEKYMNAVSVLMGCSPAYIYQIIEAMSDAGVKMGLSRELSLELSSKAVMGAGGMVNITKKHPAILKDEVTSPAGSTIEGIAELEKHGVRGAFISALYEAYQKTLSFTKKD